MSTRSRRITRGALALGAALALALPSTALAQEIQVNVSPNVVVVVQTAIATSAAISTLSGNATNFASSSAGAFGEAETWISWVGEQEARGGSTYSSAEAENTAVVVQGND